MNNQLLTHIIKYKVPCYFISPHLDDAAFSAGGLLDKLSGKVPLTVVNVFTNGGEQNTLSARAFLKQIGYGNSQDLYRDRRIEDDQALHKLNIVVDNLGYTEALWRTRSTSKLSKLTSSILPELNMLYPTYRFHIRKGKVARQDRELVNELARQLVVKIEDNALIFVPLGIGGHVDHKVVRDAAEQAFSSKRLIYWLDYPYSARNAYKLDQSYRSICSLQPDAFRKKSLCQKYVTQYREVFHDTGYSFKDQEQYYTHSLLVGEVGIWEVLTTYIKAFLLSPKDFLYTMLFSGNKNNIYLPLTRKLENQAENFVHELKVMLPGKRVELVGSVGLGIGGAGDIDVLIPVGLEDFASITKTISSKFGSPSKIRKSFVQWKLILKGTTIDLDVIDESSTRYVTQNSLFSYLKKVKSARELYIDFKSSFRNSTKRWYEVKRIIFFETLIKRFQIIKPFPFMLKELHFVNTIKFAKSSVPYRFAIYEDNYGLKYFVKAWFGQFKNANYYWMQNEINIYRLLNQAVRSSKSLLAHRIQVPKLHSSYILDGSMYEVLEHIEAKPINTLSEAKIISSYNHALNFLRLTSTYVSHQNKSLLIYRGPLYWLAILPFLAIRALVVHPWEFKNIVKCTTFVFHNLILVVRRKANSIVHRDFNNWNLMIGRRKLYLIDYQLTCIGDPLVDIAVLISKFLSNKKIINRLLDSQEVKNYLKESGSFQVLQSYVTIFCIYDMSLPDGNHHLTKNRLQECLNLRITQ